MLLIATGKRTMESCTRCVVWPFPLTKKKAESKKKKAEGILPCDVENTLDPFRLSIEYHERVKPWLDDSAPPRQSMKRQQEPTV
jgi:hypothetical protein